MYIPDEKRVESSAAAEWWLPPSVVVLPGKKLRLKRPGVEEDEVLALFMWSWGSCMSPCSEGLFGMRPWEDCCS